MNRKYDADYSLTVTPDSVDLGNSVDIKFSYENLGDPSMWWSSVTVTNEPVWFYVNGEKVGEKTISGSDSGSVTFTYTPTSTGTLTVEAFVPQNYKDTQELPRGWAGPCYVTVEGGSITPTNYFYNISTPKSTVDYFERFNVYFNADDSMSGGRVDFYINGYKVQSETYKRSGENYMYVYAAPAGILNITAYYSGDSTHEAGWTNNLIVNVNPVKSFITSDPVVMDKGDSKTLTVKLYDIDGDAIPTQYVTVTINNQDFNVKTDENGIATVNIPTNLDVKQYTVDLTYAGGDWKKYQTPDKLKYAYDYGDEEDYIHEGCTGQTTITVNSVDVSTKTSIDVSPKEVNIGDKVTITPTVTAEGKNLGVGDGKVAIYINGVKKGETDPGVGFDYTTESSGTFTVKAEYLGKDNYLKSNSSDDSFKVNKLNATLSVNPNNTNIELGSAITLTSTLTPDDATGTISYTSDDGQTGTGLSFDYTPTSEGTHTVTVYYGGNDKYNSITQTIVVNVYKASSSIKLDDELIIKVYGQSFTVTATTQNSTGNVVVRLVNKNGNAEISGVTSQGNDVTIPIIDVGEYDLYVTTNPDVNHNAATAHATIRIIPKNSTLTVDSASGNWNDEVPVKVNLGEGSEGISTAKIYDANGNIFIKDATLNDNSVSVSGLAAGTYMIKVNNTVNSNYNSVYANATVTINPVDSDVEFSDIAFVYGGSNSTGVVLTGASDFVAVVSAQGAVIDKESGKVTVSGLNVGTYDLTITTVADENHTSVSRTHKVYVTAVDSSFTVYPASGDWNTEIEVPVSLGVGSDGIASADIYDESGVNFVKSAEIRDGEIVVSGLSVGNYTVKVTNVPKDNYDVAVSEAKVTVNPVVSDVEFSDIAFVYGGSNSTGVVLTGASDFVAVVVGQDATILKESGKVTVSGLNVGTYDLTITTVADENHTSVSKTHKVNVSPLRSSVSSNDVEVTYDGKPISIEYTSRDAVNVSYTVYDKDNNVVDEGNVKANDAIEVISLPVGKYTINLKTIVDENHESVDETYGITVNNATLDFTVNAKESTYPDNATIEVKSDVDGEYLVEVNNKTYLVEVKDGVGSVVLDQLPADTYPVTVTSNVANYDKVTKNANLTIKQKAKDVITLVENYDVIKDYLNGTNYQVRVLLNGKSIGAGKVVTIKTNGVTYKCKTDKEGYARLTITLKPKKYTITAEYAGIMVSNKIHVKKVLKVKNVSKKKAKKIKFKATLKYSNGKAIVGKKVTFKLKGKVYTAKTNKKGIATVTFKNLKVGKFNVKVQYCNETSKAKLTIKK